VSPRSSPTNILSAALFERDGRALVARRCGDRSPFAGQWLLPLVRVRDDETAEEALRRHARDEFGVGLTAETFADTAYIEDPADKERYVTNIFRATATEMLRLRAGGDYEDARWLAPDDLAQVWMPPALRDPLVALLTGAAAVEALPAVPVDEETVVALEVADVTPTAQPPPETAPAPDNRTSWDAISKSYQEERFGDRFGDRLMWSWRLSEDDVRILDDVRGRRVLVLGCGGGQDVVALAKLGAVAVGIDQSKEQIAYARKYALRHGIEGNASFVEGTVEDLSRFDDESFDLAVSSHALNYVERIEDALREAHRVLRGGGSLAIAVSHPFNTMLGDEPPPRIERSYFNQRSDWPWVFEGGVSADFRQWFWTISEWFDMLTAAGFAVERIVEPREDGLPAAAGDKLDDRWLSLVPYTLIIKARKR